MNENVDRLTEIARMKRAGITTHRQEAALRAISFNESISVEELAGVIETSRAHTRNLLTQMTEKKLLKAESGFGKEGRRLKFYSITAAGIAALRSTQRLSYTRKMIEERAIMIRLGMRTISQETAFISVIHKPGISSEEISKIINASVSNTGQLLQRLKELKLVTNINAKRYGSDRTWEPTQFALNAMKSIESEKQ
jgi:DNA-binding MarR family transcriptional regulator